MLQTECHMVLKYCFVDPNLHYNFEHLAQKLTTIYGIYPIVHMYKKSNI